MLSIMLIYELAKVPWWYREKTAYFEWRAMFKTMYSQELFFELLMSRK